MKRIIAVILAAIMVFSFAACASDSDNNGKKSKKTNVEDKSLKIEDLEWTAEEGIVSGDRVLTFSITNNSEYTIKEIEMSFIQKPGVTDEQVETFWQTVKKNLDLDDTELADIRDDADEIELSSYIRSVINPGETNKTGRMHYFSGIIYCNDAAAIDLVEPDIATITYVDGDILKTVYYDFHSKKYTEDNSTEKAYQWSTFDIGNKIPKPDVKIVEVSIDYEDTFSFDVYGVSIDKWEKYIEECKTMGYAVEPYKSDGMYSADNEAGDSVLINYDNETNVMSVDVNLNDEEPTESETP